MGFDPDAFDENAFDPDAFDFADDGPPPVLSDGYMGGTAVSGLGIMQTIFLAEGVPVPVSAKFLNGVAHDESGFRYVALWPASGIVAYSSGRALRTDGAQCILEGAPTIQMAGFGYTNRGELCVSAVAGSNFIQGISVNNGLTAVSDPN